MKFHASVVGNVGNRALKLSPVDPGTATLHIKSGSLSYLVLCSCLIKPL